MAREVLSVETNSGSTTVKYRVEDFRNFGARMREIEEKHLEERHGIAQSEDGDLLFEDPESLAEIEGLAEDVTRLLDSTLQEAASNTKQQLEQLDDTGLDDASKALYKSYLSRMASSGSAEEFMQSLFDEADDSDDEGGDEPDPDESADDPQVLEICFDDPLAWTPEVQQRVDRFLDDWPRMRPKMLQAVFEAYRSTYDEDRFSPPWGTEADRIIEPSPTSPSVLEDLFQLDTIFLSAESDAIGLAGHCTWEDEHGLGMRIEHGEVVEVGEASVAFV